MKTSFYLFIAFTTYCIGSLFGEPTVDESTSLLERGTLSPRDYTFGYWKNGFRKHKGNSSADILNIETGYFGLSVDMARLDQAKFGLINDMLDYEDALERKGQSSRLRNLKGISLNVEVEKDGKIYKAVSGRASRERAAGERFQSTRLWESARYVQHYDIQGLEFKSKDGDILRTDSTLSIVAWPDSLNVSAKVAPAIHYQTGSDLGVNGALDVSDLAQCIVEKPVVIAHEDGLENERFTVEAWVKVPELFHAKSRGWILCKNKNERTDSNYGFSVFGGQFRATMNIGSHPKGSTRGKSSQNKVVLSTSHQTVIPDKWHHLAMTYDGNTFSLFVDGALKSSRVVGKKRMLGNGALSIGQRADGQGGITPVIVDRLRVWNRALNKGELRQHAKKVEELKETRGLTYNNDFNAGVLLDRPAWKDARLRISIENDLHQWSTSKKMNGMWKVSEDKKLTLDCDLRAGSLPKARVSAEMKLNPKVDGYFEPEFGCYVARINRPKRAFKTGKSALRDYDEVELMIEADEKGRIPLMLEMKRPASVTGVCPILCDEHGIPTGIPVQISKNWHLKEMGSYLRAYTLLPTVRGRQKYKLRFVYGFYGAVPSASHGQLSLVGWGGNGRWDQLAIGAWGETYCMDIDMSCVDVTVTDIRMLMARNGVDGEKWSWTDAGWGGDWLGLSDSKGDKLFINDVRAAYLAHGPCLTDVKYSGYYGASKEVDVKSTVRTLRTDDYARTFSNLSYQFDKAVKADGWLFKMGRSHSLVTPNIAYGNRAGLIEDHVVPDGLKKESTYLAKRTLTGEGPWWVAFPGAYTNDGKKWGTGYRAMIIRSYKVVAGGEEYTQPTIEFPAYNNSKDGKPNIDFLLTAPKNVSEFQPGDSVDFEVEWITLPRVVDDYYGENIMFKKHMLENPSSWRTTHREAVGNDLKVEALGGVVRSRYPIIIECIEDEIVVDIEGGVGFVPIRFDRLKKAKGYELYQVIGGKEVKLEQGTIGNDFWQTDYDAKTNTYKRTYNLPLDGVKRSRWILK